MAVRTVSINAAANITKSPKSVIWSLMAIANQQQADLAAHRAAIVALTAKMDADFADVTNASVDYASSIDPVADTSDTITTRELGSPT